MLVDRRTLNRTLLARQHLLAKAQCSVAEMVEHLAGMQAQVPTSPYPGLWSRVEGFAVDDLADLVQTGRAVRLPLMRSTIHLVTAGDALALRPVLQAVLEKDPYLRGIETGAVAKVARELVEESPRTPAELGRLLARRFPEHPAENLVHTARAMLALVQVPPRGVWGTGGAVRLTTAESWLDAPLSTSSTVEDLIVRYLRAFGPASARDFSAWSRLTGVRAAFDRLRPSLVTVRDDGGVELFDVSGAPIVDAGTPAPVRFLPEYDNLLLAHADRSRILDDQARAHLSRENGYWPFVLVGGAVRATWAIRDGAVHVEPFGTLDVAAVDEMVEEGSALADALGLDGARVGMVSDARSAGGRGSRR